VRRDDAAGDGRNADHPAAVARDHARQHVVHEQHRRADVDRLRAPPLLGADLPDRPERPGHAGVVDQQIDRPEQLLDLARGAFDRGRVGHVAAHADRVAAGIADRMGDLVQLRERPCEQCDRRTFGGEPLRDRPPEPAPRATNQCDLSVEYAHGALLLAGERYRAPGRVSISSIS
jgi:hypothetical protein